MIKIVRGISVALAGLMVASFCACGSQTQLPVSDASEAPSDIAVNPAPPDDEGPQEKKLSAWAAYWNLDNADAELVAFKEDELEVVCHFAAMFDQKGNLFTDKRTDEFFENARLGPSGAANYITIVNDVKYDNGKSLQKDTEILEPKMKNPQNRKKHIDEIIRLALDGGYDGVEIDYETVHRRKGKLLDNFVLFCGEMYEEAERVGLGLRIVLEPSFPADKVKLPPGPDYVVMFYNLHGYGTAPGPKADPDFIREIALRMQSLPGSPVYAFATGGFDWSGGGPVTALTERQARKLLPGTYEGWRDPESGGLYFTYTDEDGQNHEVWFADGETFSHWMEIARKYSSVNRFSIWRLGENELSSVEKW